MAILTISGAPASRFEEVAHGCAQLLNRAQRSAAAAQSDPGDDAAASCAQLLSFELITESRLDHWMSEEFGETPVPDRAWRPAAVSILARLAMEHHLVICMWGAESLFPSSPFLLRAGIVASEARRIGNVMLDQRLERPQAKTALARLDREAKHLRMLRLGRTRPQPDAFDVMLNSELMDASQMGEVLQAAASARRLHEQGLLAVDAEARIQFETRLKLAKHGIVPAGHARLKRAAFNHPSEEVFANLLDFYRIAWEYEPRSFPLQWDKDGRVIEAFTPDFYLPEFDLYVELTTMRQTLVTRKNRKIKMLRAVYPHINIQVFYQKDIQDLVFKHGLKDAVPVTPPPGIERVLFTEEQVNQRVKEVAAEISAKYQGRDLKLVAVLKGAVFFLTALARAIDIPLKIDFLAISSFGGSAPGMVRIAKDLDHPIQDEDILLVEDIVDTGFTTRYLLQTLAGREPRSLGICTLLDRTVRRIVQVPVDYRCFEIPDRFVVGCGLDFKQQYRNLGYIAVMDPEKS